MGNQVEKGIRPIVKKEFETLKSKQRDQLTISEIIKFQHPENYPFFFDHLGNLFVLNSSKSGTFSLQELYKFIEFCQTNLKNVKAYEFQSQLQAATTHVLLQHLQKENGENEIVDWVEQMLLKNEKNPNPPKRAGNTKFIGIQTVKILYEIFKIKMMNGMEIQQFFYLLQQCGEEAGLMAPDAKDLEEYVPVEMGKEFARQYLRGFSKLMREVGLNDDSAMQHDISVLEASIHNSTSVLNKSNAQGTAQNQLDNTDGRNPPVLDNQGDPRLGMYYGMEQDYEDEIDVDDEDDDDEDEDEEEEEEDEEDEEVIQEQVYNMNQIQDQEQNDDYNKFDNKFRYQSQNLNQQQTQQLQQQQRQQQQFQNNNFNNEEEEPSAQNLNQIEDNYKDNYFLYQQKQNYKGSANSSEQKKKSQSINNSTSAYNQDQGIALPAQQKQSTKVILPLQVNLITKGSAQNSMI